MNKAKKFRITDIRVRPDMAHVRINLESGEIQVVSTFHSNTSRAAAAEVRVNDHNKAHGAGPVSVDAIARLEDIKS